MISTRRTLAGTLGLFLLLGMVQTAQAKMFDTFYYTGNGSARPKNNAAMPPGGSWTATAG